MPSCAFAHCSHHSRNVNSVIGITFHVFPKDPARCAKWVAKIRKNRDTETFVPSKWSVVCSSHFRDRDLYKTPTGILKLRSYAEPVLNLGYDYEANERSPEPILIDNDMQEEIEDNGEPECSSSIPESCGDDDHISSYFSSFLTPNTAIKEETALSSVNSEVIKIEQQDPTSSKIEKVTENGEESENKDYNSAIHDKDSVSCSQAHHSSQNTFPVISEATSNEQALKLRIQALEEELKMYNRAIEVLSKRNDTLRNSNKELKKALSKKNKRPTGWTNTIPH